MYRVAILFLASFATAQTPPPLGKLIDLGGYRVHLYCTGEGNPTTFVAGAGYSFDWALVQSEVAKSSTICTYDVSGTAWSDPGPALTARTRVDEIHRLIQAAGLKPPLVLAGLSLGACTARLYAASYPSDLAGMVIVDHAFSPDPPPMPKGLTAPAIIESTPIVITVEDASDFQRLPDQSRQLHRWAASLHPKLPSWDDAEDCLAQLKTAAPGPYPLGNLPLVVVSTANDSRGYDRLQRELLALSRRSSQLVANRSFHAVEIDQPEIVVAAIRKVIAQSHP